MANETNPTPTIRVRRRDAYLQRYKLDTRLLRRGEVKQGKPAIAGGEDRHSGERVVIRQWRRDAAINDSDVREIWREEIRQLHRLYGFPGARDLFVRLIESGEDEGGFYLTLAPGQRLPLPTVLERLSASHWLKNPRTPRNRSIIWQSLRQVALGLDLLHMQGLLHRNLDLWSVFSAGEENDFQLSGFEWSVRLSSVAAAGRASERPQQPAFSFIQDWQAFGQMAAELLDYKPAGPVRGSTDANANAVEALTFLERDLIQKLIKPDPFFRIDATNILQRIDAIRASLSAAATKTENKLVLVASVGERGTLGPIIRRASQQTIEVNDSDAQLEFIRLDLEQGEPVLVSVVEDAGEPRYQVVGRTLTYKLKPYRAATSGAGTWDAAYCESALEQRPHSKAVRDQAVLPTRSIEVLSYADAGRRFVSMQGRTKKWNEQMPEGADELEAHVFRQYRGLLLLQLIEAFLIAAQVWPVRALRTQKKGERTRITVIAREDAEREALARSLGLQMPAVRMREALAQEEEEGEATWILGEVGVLGERDDEAGSWQFVESKVDVRHGHVFTFEGPGPAPTSERLFLRNSDFIGTDQLLRRRLRALRSLREHAELLEMLADPRSAIKRTHEDLPSPELSDLDDSKKEALQELWSTLPLYLVQGPPGVGKTRLVTELVEQRLQADSATRMLLSAQTHHAVDHLLDEVSKRLVKKQIDALIVRGRPRDYDGVPEGHDLPVAAGRVLEQVIKSAAMKDAPRHIVAKMGELQRAYTRGAVPAPGARHLARSVEALLLRAANLVFSSTNAAELDRLIDERGQFDWTIVEEAGKATGVELIAPLLLSHRRLMIGDHKQLPPFNEATLKQLLGQPTRIREALNVGRAIVGRLFREAELEEVVEEGAEEEALTAVCGEAARALVLFETMTEAEFAQEAARKGRVAIAKQLSHQHRMHPAISKLVSDAFYDGKVITAPDSLKRFEASVSPVAVKGGLPASPIVFLSMPYVQAEKGYAQAEHTPRFHNPREVAAVMQILERLQVDHRAKDKPSLAVLSPYREQVWRLGLDIKANIKTRLRNLKHFSWERDRDTPVSTVDAFQGSEADVVVISLVRNNHHDGPRALGFLGDSRRMNVLISRARWKLIIVGSLQFLETRFAANAAVPKEYSFLTRLLRTLSSLQAEPDIHGGPSATILSIDKLERLRK